MTPNKKLELELQDLFKQKEYSKVVFEITSQTNEQERSAFLCNLLGLSRVSNNNKKHINILTPSFLKDYLIHNDYNKINVTGKDLYNSFAVIAEKGYRK